MKAVLLCLLLVVACGRGSDSGRGSSAEPAARPAPVPAPAPAPPATPPPPPAPPPNVNCAALLTTEDVTQVCGAGSEVKAETNPIAVQATICALKVTRAGKDDRLASLGLKAMQDAAEAEHWTQIQYSASTPVSGVGDRAWQTVRDHPDRHSTDLDVGVTKGRLVLTIASNKNELVPTPPCTIDQLTELARRATARLP